jgi:hypothetical protein
LYTNKRIKELKERKKILLEKDDFRLFFSGPFKKKEKIKKKSVTLLYILYSKK